MAARCGRRGLALKALVKSREERGLWLEDVPEPEMGINDVKIRVPLQFSPRAEQDMVNAFRLTESISATAP